MFTLNLPQRNFEKVFFLKKRLASAPEAGAPGRGSGGKWPAGSMFAGKRCVGFQRPAQPARETQLEKQTGHRGRGARLACRTPSVVARGEAPPFRTNKSRLLIIL